MRDTELAAHNAAAIALTLVKEGLEFPDSLLHPKAPQWFRHGLTEENQRDVAAAARSILAQRARQD